jgi:4-hydroxy-tetrahydrodipicolinate synthase
MSREIRLCGIVPPVITTFKNDDKFSLDEEKQADHIEFLVKNGVHGIFPLGTAGEFALLNREERKKVIQICVNASKNDLPVIAGISDSSTLNAVTYAKDAEEAGADAVIATPPYYYSTNDEGLFNHYKMISQSVSLPVFIYNIPSWTHLSVSPQLFSRLVEREVVQGAKYTTNDLAAFIEFVKAANGRVPVLIGADALIFSGLEVGANGAIVGIGNVVPKETSTIYETMKTGEREEAWEMQQRIFPLVQKMMLGTFPVALKEMLAAMGRNVGPVRPPLVPLNTDERRQITTTIREYTTMPQIRIGRSSP